MKTETIGNFHGIRADIISHDLWGAAANALIIELPEARNILSSRDGLKRVKAISNCYLPETLWPELHSNPSAWPAYLEKVLSYAELSPEETSSLSTGVNMNYLAWHEETYEELWTLAFVTAGVASNAMRIGIDRASTVERNGQFDRVGTINTILFTSSDLDMSAMAASFIIATEAKNIALQEMHVMSCYSPGLQATGTGTDQIVTVPGTGPKCRYVGGHTRLGEMIARSVTSATVQAIENSSKALH